MDMDAWIIRQDLRHITGVVVVAMTEDQQVKAFEINAQRPSVGRKHRSLSRVKEHAGRRRLHMHCKPMFGLQFVARQIV